MPEMTTAQTNEADNLREELLKGERSGEPKPFDIDAFLKRKAASDWQPKQPKEWSSE